MLGPPPGIWYGIIGVVMVFVMLGLVMVLSASAITEANRGNWAYSVFFRQAMWAGFGLVGLVAMARIPYTAWRRFTSRSPCSVSSRCWDHSPQASVAVSTALERG